MSSNVERLVTEARPNIEEVLEAFLKDQRRRISAKTFSRYKSVVELLQRYLDGYAYESLSDAESRFFDRRFNAEGKDHREFCQLFGPEKISANLHGFLSVFLIRKVMAGEDFKKAAGTVTHKLSKWLAEKEYVSPEVGEEGAELGSVAARRLVEAERAGRLLQEAADRLGIETHSLPDADYVDFDHFTIARVEPGKLWLEDWESGTARPRGPIPAPKSATQLLRTGWDVSCALARHRGVWHLVEIGNVYPL